MNAQGRLRIALRGVIVQITSMNPGRNAWARLAVGTSFGNWIAGSSRRGRRTPLTTGDSGRCRQSSCRRLAPALCGNHCVPVGVPIRGRRHIGGAGIWQWLAIDRQDLAAAANRNRPLGVRRTRSRLRPLCTRRTDALTKHALTATLAVDAGSEAATVLRREPWNQRPCVSIRNSPVGG